jgi:hypothetical protein
MPSATTGAVANTHANPGICSDTNTEYESVGDTNGDAHSGTDGDTSPGAACRNPCTRPF